MGMGSSYDLQHVKGVLARKDFQSFARWIMPQIQMTMFHENYYAVLDAFAKGRIKKLIVSVPPQHGKSLGSSQLLPAFMLGLNPELSICIGSYSFSLATKFNKRVQRLIKDEQYKKIFPETTLKDSARDSTSKDYMQTSEQFEIVGHTGGLIAAGREGSITGNKVDVMIIDDLYKDAMEANSPLVRENTWEFYTSVVKTRLHNDSQELIVFTRWHEDDLIGRMESKDNVVELESMDQIVEGFDGWYKLNFEAIKESQSTPIDSRKEGAPLWPDRHGLKLLNEKRALDKLQFDCMYQGMPSSKEGLLYGDNFMTYDQLPSAIIKYGNYTDTADMGSDRLCSICYAVTKAGKIYVTDVEYSSQPMEVTEIAVADMLKRNLTRVAHVESNNGGRGYARALQRLHPQCLIKWFHQSGNKEARILTNSATVVANVYMPEGWQQKWPGFYGALISFKRVFKANRHDDAADALTGVVEMELISQRGKIKAYI